MSSVKETTRSIVHWALFITITMPIAILYMLTRKDEDED